MAGLGGGYGKHRPGPAAEESSGLAGLDGASSDTSVRKEVSLEGVLNRPEPPRGFWFSRFGVGPQALRADMFPGSAGAADPRCVQGFRACWGEGCGCQSPPWGAGPAGPGARSGREFWVPQASCASLTGLTMATASGTSKASISPASAAPRSASTQLRPSPWSRAAWPASTPTPSCCQSSALCPPSIPESGPCSPSPALGGHQLSSCLCHLLLMATPGALPSFPIALHTFPARDPSQALGV